MAFSNQDMENMAKAISTFQETIRRTDVVNLQKMIRCTDRGELRKVKRMPNPPLLFSRLNKPTKDLHQETGDIDKAISTLQELIECTDLEQVQKLIRKFEELARSTSKEGLNLKNMPSVYELNEKTKALVQKVEKLCRRGLDLFEEKRGNFLPTPKLLVGATTALRNMEEVWDLIIGDAKKIGVYGMGGIGKTTILKHINNRVLEERKDKFDCVLWVSVSNESSVFKLQDSIARVLELDLSNHEDTTVRAGAIFKAFKNTRRYLLILDNLWEGYPLEDVGIPDPDDPNSSDGCKLVLTTRLYQVCQSMKFQAIRMDLLSKEEAWSLFLNHVGPDVLHDRDLEPIARDVASECACLPLAIATIAASMRGEKETCEWKDTLRKLREFSKEPDDKGKKVIEQLKFSFDRLENKKLQKCLLLCALYPEDFWIERRELVQLLALEGIIEEKESLMDEIIEGNAMLNNLIKQCLLEGQITSLEKSWVKMHDLVRDMVLQIDGLHSRYLAVSGAKSRKLRRVKWSEDLLKIHISDCHSLNVSPKCPTLTTFILQDQSLTNIPDSFFQHFKALQIVNLFGCRSLKVLPEVISDLVDLVGLLLRDCRELRYVPSLAKLQNLRSLDLSLGISLSDLQDPIDVPEGLEELSNLRYLSVVSSGIKIFPPGIISRLSNIQCLSFSPAIEVSVDELMDLEDLEMFKGGFHGIHDLRAYVEHREQNETSLTHYTFLVCGKPKPLSINDNAYWDDSFAKAVILENCNLDIPISENDMHLLPKDVQVLEMDRVHDFSSLCAVDSLNYATDLRSCKITNCSGVKELVSASSSSSFVLQRLEVLQLVNLENLEVLIGRKKAPCNVFPCLKVLTIGECHRIKVLFHVGWASNLCNLESFTVYDCAELEEIIGESSDDLKEGSTGTVLPKLSHLKLYDLPHLRSICPASTLWISKSLRDFQIDSCPELKPYVYADPQPPWVSQAIQFMSHLQMASRRINGAGEIKIVSTSSGFKWENIQI